MNNYASATVTAAPSDESKQRSYLEQRLYDVYCTKRDPLQATFGLQDDAAPATPEELNQRIKDGKFIIRGLDGKKDMRFYYWTDMFQWRDPSRKADVEGYEAAKADLKSKRQDALDTIKIDTPAAGLAALKALEAWEPTTAAS